MPDRLKDIYDTLEAIQAGGGLGGGGGSTDVSTLATEVSLAEVVTNTAATTVAIGTLGTNVVAASEVQTLSLNSATSAQTVAITSALSAQTTTLGGGISGTTSAVQAGTVVLDSIDNYSSSSSSSLSSIDTVRLPAVSTALGTVNTSVGAVTTALGGKATEVTLSALKSAVDADAIVQGNIYAEVNSISGDTSALAATLVPQVSAQLTTLDVDVRAVTAELSQGRGKAKTLILESYRNSPFPPESLMNLGDNLGLWGVQFGSQSIFTAVEVLGEGRIIKLTGYGEHWMPDVTLGGIIDHCIDKFIDEDGLFTSCGAGCLTQFTPDSMIVIPKMQTMGLGCLAPVFSIASTHDTGMVDVSSLVSAPSFMGGVSASGIYLTIKRNEIFAATAEYQAVKAVAHLIEVPVGSGESSAANLASIENLLVTDAVVQADILNATYSLDGSITQLDNRLTSISVDDLVPMAASLTTLEGLIALVQESIKKTATGIKVLYIEVVDVNNFLVFPLNDLAAWNLAFKGGFDSPAITVDVFSSVTVVGSWVILTSAGEHYLRSGLFFVQDLDPVWNSSMPKSFIDPDGIFTTAGDAILPVAHPGSRFILPKLERMGIGCFQFRLTTPIVSYPNAKRDKPTVDLQGLISAGGNTFGFNSIGEPISGINLTLKTSAEFYSNSDLSDITALNPGIEFIFNRTSREIVESLQTLNSTLSVHTNYLYSLSEVNRPLTSLLKTSVVSSTNSTTILVVTGGSLRRSVSVFNNSTSNLYLQLGATATKATADVVIAAGGYYEMPKPLYMGVISGIWDTANGNASVCEGR